MSSYYEREMEQVNFNGEFLATVQFKSDTGETRWLNVNKECAKYIIKALNEYMEEA